MPKLSWNRTSKDSTPSPIGDDNLLVSKRSFDAAVRLATAVLESKQNVGGKMKKIAREFLKLAGLEVEHE